MPRPSRLEQLKRAYVEGRITLERFEADVEALLASGLEDEPPAAPPTNGSYVQYPLSRAEIL